LNVVGGSIRPRHARLGGPVLAALASVAFLPGALAAQTMWGAQVTPVFTRADPVARGSSLTELRFTAPLLFGSANLLGGRVRLHAMLDGEGWTMPHGQLATGAFGEGWEDRRHPHTWAHELIASASDLAPLPAGVQWSVTAGKGFVAYGTDDPMTRPALIYPVNHHWSQILERAVVILGLRRGPLTVEGTIFNGDEPVAWDTWPNLSRFGDSWAARAAVQASSAVELQASYAHVKSPENRAGAGPDQDKVSVSARVEQPLGSGRVSGLAEWAYTSEAAGFFKFYSGLAEAQWSRAVYRAYLRLERTDRPEDERVFGNPFRTVRPLLESSIIGVTRWFIATGGYGHALTPERLPVHVEAIAEVAHARVSRLTGLFDPASQYGRNDLWMISVALRIAAGAPMHRMGRYGAAEDGHSTMAGMHDMD
jgi:hypothetical protein